jgi:conjugal transfer pilus assembly protein TraF
VSRLGTTPFLALMLYTPVTAVASAPDPKPGYWWYAPKTGPTAQEPEDIATPSRPRIPPMNELAAWSPPRIRKLIEDQRDYAATVLTVEAVADFWRLEDFARRKARAFAGVTQLAMLQNPELNSRSANPMVGDARDRLLAHKDETRRRYLRARAAEFALVMFSRESCGYCRIQWPIVQRFQDEMGWQVSLMDLDRRPELGERFGIEATPVTLLIRRGTNQRMIVASGVEAYPALAQMTYQAVRLLSGDIRPEQFMTGAGEEGGFFDALGLGPVSASDPRASGGALLHSNSASGAGLVP